MTLEQAQQEIEKLRRELAETQTRECGLYAELQAAVVDLFNLKSHLGFSKESMLYKHIIQFENALESVPPCPHEQRLRELEAKKVA